jgi:signal transduction histidine kinase
VKAMTSSITRLLRSRERQNYPFRAARAAAAPAPDDDLVRLVRALLGCWTAVRAVHLGQGLVETLVGPAQYSHPVLAGIVLIAAVAETSVLVWRCGRTGQLGAWQTYGDAAFSCVGLIVLGAAAPHGGTTSLNWMVPYSQGSIVIVAFGQRRPWHGASWALALTGAYLFTARHDLASAEHASTALANLVSYAGLYLFGTLLIRPLRRLVYELQVTRQQARDSDVHLAEERERNRVYRLVHDSALSTLDAVAGGLQADPARVRRQARVDAARLRQLLPAGDDAAVGSVILALRDLVVEAADRGLVVELVTESLGHQPDPEQATALIGACREALANVVKHAGTTHAVVHAATAGDSLEVTVRDHGRGFDSETVASGFGISQSITGRLIDVGGSAAVWSRPGSGTRITLRVPRRQPGEDK